MGTTFKSQRQLWLKLLIAIVVIVGLLIIFKHHHGFGAHSHQASLSHPQAGGVAKMLGTQATSPETLPSYQAITGVLNIQHWVTKQGANVYFVRVPTLALVDIQVVFDAGSARNGDKGGLAYLTNRLLADGTTKLSADQVAENFDKVGAQYSATSQRDMAILSFRSLSAAEKFVPALNTLAQILSQPDFPQTGLKREQEKALNSLKQQEQSPDYVASRAFYTALYGNHPYGNWVLGDANSLKAITVEDLKAFHQKYYVAKNAVIAIVGDLTAPEANAVAETLMEHSPQGDKAPALPTVSDLTKPVLKEITFPSAQTHIFLGEPGIKQGDPDYYALYAGNHILGGNGSVTRMFDVIRNQHGLAYSPYSTFTPMHERGPFVLNCQTRNDSAKQSLELMQKLLQDFISQGPTDKELDQAKKNLLGGFALQFDSNLDICRQISAIGFYGLPLDYFNQFKPSIEKLTLQDIKQVFGKKISPTNFVIITVGGKPGEKGEAAPKSQAPQASPISGGAQG